MRAVTPFRYLVGHQDAAQEIAASPWSAVGIGFLFVASAALAREYDGEYLVAEPEHLALPFVASVGAATLMFIMLWLALLRRGGPRPSFVTTYARWLALFLWTAPLAWVYAVPWERLLEPTGAAYANLATLVVVAVWRVVLMVGAGATLLGAPSKAVTSIILGVSAPVVLVGLMQNAAPLLATMGGVRLEEGAAAAGSVSMTLLPCALFICPALALHALQTLVVRDYLWQPAAFEAPPARSAGALGVALAALLAGGGLLAIGQPEFKNAHDVEATLARGDLDGTLRLLSARKLSDFPPHWSPPPAKPRGAEEIDRLLTLVERVHADPATPAWLRTRYVDVLCKWLQDARWHLDDDGPVPRRVERLLADLPADEQQRIDDVHWGAAAWLRERRAARADAAPITSPR
jgi:hypothetical protein